LDNISISTREDYVKSLVALFQEEGAQTMSRTYKLIQYFLLSCVLLSTISITYGQEIKLKAAIERDSIWLGDQIKLMLIVEQPVGAKIGFPRNQDSIAGKIEVLKRSIIDTTKLDANRLQLKQTFLITCFDSGPHIVPPFISGFRTMV